MSIEGQRDYPSVMDELKQVSDEFREMRLSHAEWHRLYTRARGRAMRQLVADYPDEFEARFDNEIEIVMNQEAERRVRERATLDIDGDGEPDGS